jgi:DNA-binding protein HU-beta
MLVVHARDACHTVTTQEYLPMKKRELAAAVAGHVDIDQKIAAKVIDGTLEVILATVAKGEDVTLTGFAKWSKVKRAARIGRNPQTGAPVKIKAKTVAKITPLKGFKDIVLGVAPAPKLVGVKKVSATAKKVTVGVKAAPTKAAASPTKAAASPTKATAAPAKATAAPTKVAATKAATAKKAPVTTTTPVKKAPARAKKV